MDAVILNATGPTGAFFCGTEQCFDFKSLLAYFRNEPYFWSEIWAEE